MEQTRGRPTIIDIAKRAGVSFKTVSRVLNDHPRVAADLRERVMRAAAELDYRPNIAARSLAGNRGFAIAMINRKTEITPTNIDSIYVPPFLAEIQAGAQLACQEVGYHFFVELVDFSAPDLLAELSRQLARVAIDGIVLAPPGADDLALLDALDALGKPYVRLAPGVDLDRTAAVAADEYGGALAMTRHLLVLGHRRLGFVAGPQEHVAAGTRLVAVRDALAEWPEPVTLAIEHGDFVFHSGLVAADALLRADPRPTAIFAANDDMAAGAIAAVYRAGLRIPEQVSVVGFDDSATARLTWPPLTTVRQPVRGMTREAIRYLVDLAAGRDRAAERIELPAEIVQRGSAAPPPADQAAKS